MPIDRESTLRQAEKLYRQGRLDAAIAEYVRLVEDQPRDWNAINALGDLYLQAGAVDRAVAQFVHIADHLFSEGFFPKAAAVYKKALKARPHHEHTLLRLAEIAAAQELLADARGYLRQLWELRSERGDDRGAAECLIRLAQLPEADAEAKLTGARACLALGDTQKAVALFRDAADQLERAGRIPAALEALSQMAVLDPADGELRRRIARQFIAIGQPGQAAAFLDQDSAGADPDLLLALARIQLGQHDHATARTTLTRLIMRAPERAPDLLRLAGELRGTADAPGAFLCADVVADDAVLRGDWDRATGVLHDALEGGAFIPALRKLVDVAVDAERDDVARDARERLADAYLAHGQAADAQAVAEALLRDRPQSREQLERLRRALELSGEADVDAAISRVQERIRAEVPQVAPADNAPLEAAPEPALPEEPPDLPRVVREVMEVDLSDALAALGTAPAAVPVPPSPPPAASVSPDLEAVFDAMRPRGAEYHSVAEAAALYERGLQRLETGDFTGAAADLTSAAHVPAFRFSAAIRLGREYVLRHQPDAGIEWLERAAEMPAPSRDEGLAVLYELAAALEGIDEHARALAVLMEIEAEDRGYRDVAQRIAVLTRALDQRGA